MAVPRRLLRPPALPARLHDRSTLRATMNAGRGPDVQATLLWGPPGVGKSVLAAHYASEAAVPLAWVSLVATDLAGLVEQLCAAIALALPGASDHPARLLQGEAAPARLLRHTAGLVAGELEALAPAGALVVLDGLDALADAPLALEWLEHLIDFFPPESQLVVIGRPRPPLRLAPLRLAGGVVEIAPAAFMLDDAEADAAIATLFGPAMPKAVPRARAAGWMAALAWAARTGAEPATALADPAPLVAYLRETWVDRLPAARRAALAALATQPEFAADDAASEAGLAQGDVLLTNAGAGRRTLHPVLARALGTPSDPAATDARARAAALEADAPDEALRAWLSAGAPTEAWRLLDRLAPELVERGATERLERLLAGFPADLRGAPAWQLARGELDRLGGHLDTAETCFRTAERATAAPDAGADPVLHGRALLGRATLEAMRGGEALGPLAEAALRAFPPTAGRWRAAAEGLLGVHALHRSQGGAWREHLGRARDGFRAAGDQVGMARALHNLALGHAYAGDHDVAIRLYGEAIAAMEAAGRVPFPMTPINRGLLRAFAGDLAGGRDDAEGGLRLARERGSRRDAAFGLWVLAKLHTREGRWSLAAGLFEEARTAGREAGDALVQADALAGLAEVALRRGLPARAEELVAAGSALRGLAWSDPSVYELALVAGPALATLGRRAEAVEGLERLTALMEANDESPYRRARVLITLAGLLTADPARTRALRDRARALATLHGYPDLLAALGEPAEPDAASPEGPGDARGATAVAAPPPELSLSLFGRLEAAVDGVPVAPARWRGPRIRLLLAYLFLERHGASREQLEAAFFGGADASRAAVPLMIKRLREALEPDLAKPTASRFVLFEDGRYVLNRARGIDAEVDRFRHTLELAAATARTDGPRAAALLEEALGLYRGPLLAGFDEDWAVAAREGARRKAMAALRRLGALLIAGGRATDALRWAERLGKLDRLAEEPTLVRMEALAALGRRDEARRAAADLGARLKRELGIGASDEVEALARTIMRGEWQRPTTES